LDLSPFALGLREEEGTGKRGQLRDGRGDHSTRGGASGQNFLSNGKKGALSEEGKASQAGKK